MRLLSETARIRIVALLLAALLVLAVLPGSAAAATRAGGTVVVEEGETVDGLEAFAGSVVIRGTVDGDLSAFAGDVTVARSGAVTGDVSGAVGSLQVLGTVGGDVSVSAGSVAVGPAATVGGSLHAGAGSVTVAGRIEGDLRAGADVLRITGSAHVGGTVEYDADTFDLASGATVEGGVVENSNLGGPLDVPLLPSLGDWVISTYLLLVNLLLGAILLAAFPGASRGIADRVAASPLRTAGIGLLAMIAVPVVLVMFAITVVGIPITVVGALLFALVAWVAYVWGQFAVGTWLLSLGDYRHRWVALLVGLVAVALVGYIPVLGALAQFAVLLLGLGALAALVIASRRGDEGAEAGGTDAEPL